MDNSLLAVRGINHKYIVVERKNEMKKVNDTTKLNRNFVWVKHIIKTKNDKDITQNVVIGKKHLDTGLFLVSPYSDLPSSIKNKKITTQLAYANVVVPFLNYAATLEKFYMFLRERGIEFSGYIQGVSLFNGKYEKSKPRGSKDVLHNLKPEYLPLFLNTAIEVNCSWNIYWQLWGIKKQRNCLY